MEGLRVLIVEDDPFWLGLLREYVATAVPTADIIITPNITAALAALSGFPPPDLLITDIMWPKYAGGEATAPNGRQLVQQARARCIPVIAITGEVNNALLVRNLFAQDQVTDVFLKDNFQRDEMVRRVRDILKSRAPVTQQRIKEWVGPLARTMAAVVLTDIVGSAELAKRIGDESWKRLIKAHYEAGGRLIRQQHGCEVHAIGDEFLALFRTAAEALDFCLEFHMAPGAKEIRIRAGCHVGSVEVADEDILGSTIHLLSRVMKLIRGPEIWFTDSAKSQVKQIGAEPQLALIWTEHSDCDLREYGQSHLWSVRRRRRERQRIVD